MPWVPLRGLSPQQSILSHFCAAEHSHLYLMGAVCRAGSSHPACIIPTCCATSGIQFLEGAEGWVGLSELLRGILYERFQNKPINPFFYMLEIAPCLLVKPVRKKTWVFFFKKVHLQHSPMVACTGSSQNPTVTPTNHIFLKTMVSAFPSRKCSQRRTLLPAPAVAEWMASAKIICTGNFIAKKL